MGTSTIDDTGLLQQACEGDLDALGQLVGAHLHPAWRLAVVSAPDLVSAERALVDGFCDGLLAHHRQPDAVGGLRARIVTTTRHAAAAQTEGTPALDRDPVVAAFRALPEGWRVALWLIEVEGGSAEQVAPVLGLTRANAATLADRAAAGLRDRLAADVADRAVEPECRRALGKLPAHAAGKLTADERAAVGAHLAGCGTCAVWLAALVSPRPALRRLITAPPATAGFAIEARWLELLEKQEHMGWMAPFTERAVGAAAAALLLVGIAGAALLGGRNRTGDDGPELALPAASEPASSGGPDTGGAPPVADPGAGTGTTGGSTGTGSTGTGSGTGTGSTGSTSGGGAGTTTTGGGRTTGTDRSRSTGAPPATTPSTPTPAPSTPTTPTTPPTTPPTPPSDPDPGDPPDTADPVLGVPGVVEVQVGDDGSIGVEVLGTVGVGVGGPDVVKLDVPGLT